MTPSSICFRKPARVVSRKTIRGFPHKGTKQGLKKDAKEDFAFFNYTISA